jgi:hypothetical protein
MEIAVPEPRPASTSNHEAPGDTDPIRAPTGDGRAIASGPPFDAETCTQEQAMQLDRSKLKLSEALRLYERGISVPDVIGEWAAAAATLATRLQETR